MAAMYQHSSIYKLCCKDPSITDCYVGSTCNVRTRRDRHRRRCVYESEKGYNLRLYQFIRAHGGWDNWTMVVLEEFSCETRVQRNTREHEWFQRLRDIATLNSCVPGAFAVAGSKDQYMKDRYAEKRDELNAKSRVYHHANKDRMNSLSRQYRIDHHDEVRAKANQPIPCDHCGEVVARGGMSRHKQTQKCQQRKTTIEPQTECDLCGASVTRYKLPRHKQTKKCLAARESPT